MTQEQEKQGKQHSAAIIRGLWEALIGPKWDKDTLIEMGKLIFMRTALKDMPQKKFDLLFPRLVEVAGELDARFEIVPKAPKEEATPAAKPPVDGGSP